MAGLVAASVAGRLWLAVPVPLPADRIPPSERVGTLGEAVLSTRSAGSREHLVGISPGSVGTLARAGHTGSDDHCRAVVLRLGVPVRCIAQSFYGVPHAECEREAGHRQLLTLAEIEVLPADCDPRSRL